MKNCMNNMRILQNYSPAQARYSVKQDPESKERWLNIFNQAIEDLKKGYYINGKDLKNNVWYWEDQIKMLKEL